MKSICVIDISYESHYLDTVKCICPIIKHNASMSLLRLNFILNDKKIWRYELIGIARYEKIIAKFPA
jgi:hypothetical protein